MHAHEDALNALSMFFPHEFHRHVHPAAGLRVMHTAHACLMQMQQKQPGQLTAQPSRKLGQYDIQMTVTQTM